MIFQDKQFLITRSVTQSDHLQTKIQDFGGSIIRIPTISITEPPNWTAFDQVIQNIQKFDWVLFTSSNTILKLLDRLKILQIPQSTLSHLKVAVVGRQTKKVAEDCGFQVEVVPKTFQGKDLLKALLDYGVQDQKIWFPRALEANPDLLNGLQNAGIKVTLTPVYQNIIPFENATLLEQTLEQQIIDWVIFTSSSTAKNFFTLLGEKKNTFLLPKIASIGKSTTETLNSLNYHPQFTAVPQNLDGIIQGLTQYYS
ncbi:MAG: uroporphyrinogen III methyltransferase/synthase [bacterium]|jgi:uroporphyrinogen III methyltransferase/synthase